jgi:hypothetical protein
MAVSELRMQQSSHVAEGCSNSGTSKAALNWPVADAAANWPGGAPQQRAEPFATVISEQEGSLLEKHCRKQTGSAQPELATDQQHLASGCHDIGCSSPASVLASKLRLRAADDSPAEHPQRCGELKVAGNSTGKNDGCRKPGQVKQQHSNHHHSHGNQTIRGAIVHLLADIMQSLGLCVAAAVVW